MYSFTVGDIGLGGRETQKALNRLNPEPFAKRYLRPLYYTRTATLTDPLKGTPQRSPVRLVTAPVLALLRDPQSA